MKYYAHYDRVSNVLHPLSEHLHAVARYGEQTVPPPVSFPGLSNQDVRALAQMITLLHDLGKYTDFFQSYLIDGSSSEFKSHAHISACFARGLALDRLAHVSHPHARQAWAFLAYLCVRFHHGNPTFQSLFSDDVWHVLEVQHANLTSKWPDILADLGLQADSDFLRLPERINLRQWQLDTLHFLRMPQHLAGRLKQDYWFFALQYFFSLLIDADKLDSGGVSPSAVKVVPSTRVTDYLKAKHGSERHSFMMGRRENARRQMLSVLERMTDEQLRNERFFTITAPTGIGKTLASLQCALYMQERIARIEGYTPRIITAIPFINIIEQTRWDYEAVFGEDAHVLVHHRLADLSAPTAGFDHAKEEQSLEKRLLLTEAWEADVVLTTFVQLFHSIFTNRNRPLKKLHKLAGSIVILDEVQAIPEKYMPMIGAVLRKMAEFYGTRFILMTATQPKLLELGDRLLEQPLREPVELLPNHKDYFSGMTRTRLIPFLDRKRSADEFLSLFLETWKPTQSALVVVNTIRRSKEIYDLLVEARSEGRLPETAEIYYLSTNIVPWQRRQVIDTVRKRLAVSDGTPLILVSTQTIEAGVDLDFDIGYRDLAPLESIIQTAGRVNRRGEKGEFCPVFVIRLGSDAQYVYDLHHVNRTAKLLSEWEHIHEPDYQELMTRYYDRLADDMSFDVSRELWNEGVIRLDLERLNEFQLIETKGVVDVYVELTEEASRFADEYQRLMQAPDMSSYEKKAALRRVMTAMSEYMIQVRISRLLGNRPVEFVARGEVEGHFFWVPPGQVHEFYDMATGFKDEHGEAYLY